MRAIEWRTDHNGLWVQVGESIFTYSIVSHIRVTLKTPLTNGDGQTSSFIQTGDWPIPTNPKVSVIV